jgi:hypothetical protein
MSALGYATALAQLNDDLAFEEAAVTRYGQMAAAARDPRVKGLFKELVRGEAGHRRGLRHVIDRVVDETQAVILYCPLCGWELDFGAAPPDGAVAKCRMCPGKFKLRLDAAGDWTLERIHV